MKIVSCFFDHWQLPLLLSVGFFGESFMRFHFFPIIKSNLLFPLLSSFSMLFFIIPENIYLCLNPNKIKNKKKHKIQFYFGRITDIKFQVEKNKVRFKKWLLLITLGVITVFNHSISSHFILMQSYCYITTQPLLCLTVTWVFHYIAFKQPLYRHHLTVLVIMYIDTIVYYIHSFWTISKLIHMLFGNWGGFLGLLVLNVFSISLREEIEKYLMDIHFVSPSFILLNEGFMSLFLYAVYIVIVQIVSCDQANGFFSELCYSSKWLFLKENFVLLFNYSSIDTLYIWLFVVLCFGINFFRIRTNRILSPTHRYIAEILILFYWFVLNLINEIIAKRAYATKYIPVVLDCILLSLACSVYNEDIIIHLCQLNVNTRKEIEKRASCEAMETSITREFSSSNESLEMEHSIHRGTDGIVPDYSV